MTNINPNSAFSLFGQGSLYQSLDQTDDATSASSNQRSALRVNETSAIVASSSRHTYQSPSLSNRLEVNDNSHRMASPTNHLPHQTVGSDDEDGDLDHSAEYNSPNSSSIPLLNQPTDTFLASRPTDLFIPEEEEDVPSSLLFENHQPSNSPQKKPILRPNAQSILNQPSTRGNAKSQHSVLFTNPPKPKRKQPFTGTNRSLPLPVTAQSNPPGKVRSAVQTVFRHNAVDPEGRHGVRSNLGLIDPKERALWKWANVENLDNFLQEVYNYYLGNGFYCILLSRLLNMATVMFVVGFSTYLSSCIDYSRVRTSSKLSEVQYPQCISRLGVFPSFLLWLFTLFWFMKLIQYVYDIQRLLDLKNFYFYLLDISEAEMQTISWQQVVKRLMNLRDQNPTTSTTARHNDRLLGTQSKQRMDPHDIANRIMRKENYLIAMINKNVLDLTLPIPFYKEPFLTRTVEWNLSLCIMDFVFNENGQVRPIFLKENQRKVLIDGLRRRFMFAGFTNILCAPFTVVYLALLYFFRYFNEYHKDPGSIGTRQYTPLAEWKMRELNELYHLFQRRLNMSYEPASFYVNQFPKEKTVLFSRFVVFVTGSFAAVLGIISLVDPELFLGFEITEDKTVLFYIGLFASILAFSRSMIPSESFVFDPETSLKRVAEFTHYLPEEWDGRLHTDEVKTEFAKLYDLKIMVIIRELASVIIIPFLLWFSLTKSSERIVDFFREFTIHVDGLGYVCTFATFDFNAGKKKSGYKPKRMHGGDAYGSNREDDENDFDLRQNYYATTDGKMLKSYLNFLEHYGGANDGPTSSGSVYGRPAVLRVFSGNNGGGMANSRLTVAGPSDSIHSGDMENSVMGRFNRIHHQIQSGTTTPLARSGVLDASVMSLGGGISGAISTAFNRKSRRPLASSKRKSPFVAETINSDDETDDEAIAKAGHDDGEDGAPYNLGDSFVTSIYPSRRKSVTKGAMDDEESDEESDGSEKEGAGGVLGLLNQFYQQTDVTKF